MPYATPPLELTAKACNSTALSDYSGTKACVTALNKAICNDEHTHHACAEMHATLDMYLSYKATACQVLALT